MKEHNYQVAKDNASLTNQLLEKYELPPNPINYSVFFVYINKSIPILIKKLDLLIKNNAVNDDAINTLYETHISQVKKVDKEILSPLNQSVDLILSKLAEQVSSEEEAVNNLAKIDKALMQTHQQSALSPIVDYLKNTVNGSVAQHKNFSEELTKTNNEITELKMALDKVKNEAISDPLTGFLNRRGGDEKLSEIAIEKTHTTMMIDIDHFKLINDNFGHSIGDKVIQKVAQSIKGQLSDVDITVRYGGEEFVVIAVNKALFEAKEIAEKIRIAICKLKLKQKNSDVFLPQISVSIGMAETKNDNHWNAIIERADKALYDAKNSGRNCIKING